MPPQSTPPIFPSLPEGLETRLAAIEMALATQPSYLDDRNCPYSANLKGLLRRLCKVNPTAIDESEREFSNAGDEDKFDLALREIEATIDEMEAIGKLLQGAEAPDRIQFVKAKTSLVEKWVSIKEKIFNVRELSEFQSLVIRVMDETLSVDQRQLFIEGLRKLRTTMKIANSLTEETK